MFLLLNHLNIQMNDKQIEKDRYDHRALHSFGDNDGKKISKVSSYLEEPYEHYYRLLNKISLNSKILEIGAGMGENTNYLSNKVNYLIATDISYSSVAVMKKKFAKYDNFMAQVSDMESLPFDDNSFDIVCSAGSISYGNNQIVMDEIHRVLKKGGSFIAVDSLNNNLIYRINRYFHYLRGNRSKSTLLRMPNIKLIKHYEAKFGNLEIKYFGSLVWLFPIIEKFISDKKIKMFSKNFDSKFKIKKSAFKFVMKVTK